MIELRRRRANFIDGRPALVTDRYDRRKLLYHPRAVAELLETGDCWPVTVNTGFTTYCNHSCAWCSSAYTTRVEPSAKARNDLIIVADTWIENIRILAERGTRGLIIAGQGEPLLHPEALRMLEAATETGMKFMLFTNGQRLHEKYLDCLLEGSVAIRFSVDAATREMHERWHAASNANGKGRADFDAVIKNISALVSEKKRRGLTLPDIGCQMVCSSLTRPDFEAFAALFKEIGVDYVAYKSLQSNDSMRAVAFGPDSLHASEEERRAYAKDMVEELMDIKRRYETESFSVHVKAEQINEAYVKNYNGAERYEKCRAHPLVPMIEPSGEVYVCIDHGGDREMVIGNIYDNDISEIWRSERRREVISRIDLKKRCPAGCFLDQTNVLLEELSDPDPNLHTMLI